MTGMLHKSYSMLTVKHLTVADQLLQRPRENMTKALKDAVLMVSVVHTRARYRHAAKRQLHCEVQCLPANTEAKEEHDKGIQVPQGCCVAGGEPLQQQTGQG